MTKMSISLHIASILKEKELDESVVKSYFTTAADGKRYNVIYYALEMILAVGFRVRGVRGTQQGTRRLTICGARMRRSLQTRRIWRTCDESMNRLERILQAIKGKGEELKDVGVNVGVKLSARERDLLELLRLDGTLTAVRIAETYSISTRQSERLLTGLKKKGFLVRVHTSDQAGMER